MIRDLILKNRSYRKFFQNETISLEILKECTDLARLSPSAANLQELKYIITNDPAVNAKVYESLTWAGYLPDWDGPEHGERPAAYIIILGDTSIKKTFTVNHGIAAQSILLGAVEKGLGGCILAAVDRKALQETLSIPASFEILLVVALGKPHEEVVIESIPSDGSIKYWRDEHKRHHVPKRGLNDVIVAAYGK